MVYYKVLGEDGSPCHGGTGRWKRPHGTRPGAWMPRLDHPVLCQRGYHLCRREDLLGWLGPVIYEAEVASDAEIIAGDRKVVTGGRVRLVRRLTTWTERTARLFAADCAETVLPLWEAIYPADLRPREAIAAARAYARGTLTAVDLRAAERAAWIAAASAAGYAAWNVAWIAAGSGAVSAAGYAAWNAAWNVAGSASASAAQRAAGYAAGSASASAAQRAAGYAAGSASASAAVSAAVSAAGYAVGNTAEDVAWIAAQRAAGYAAWNAAGSASASAAASAALLRLTDRLCDYLEGRAT